MSYCDKCNVKVEESLMFCPLCGRCVNENAPNTPANFPSYKEWEKNRLFVFNLLNVFLLIAVLAAALVDYFIFKEFFIVLHILFPALILHFAVIKPIKHKWSFSNQNNVFLIMVVAYLVWLEWFIPVKGWALSYAVPLTLLASSVYNFFVIIMRKYNRFEHLMILITSAVIAIIIFVTNLVNGFVTWPTISAFSTSVALLFFVILLKRKNVKNELAKKFHI